MVNSTTRASVSTRLVPARSTNCSTSALCPHTPCRAPLRPGGLGTSCAYSREFRHKLAVMSLEIDVADPEYELVWPRDIFRTEASNLLARHGSVTTEDYALFLEESFAGNTPADDLRAAASRYEETGFGFGAGALPRSPAPVPRQPNDKAFMQALLSKVDSLMTPRQRAPYWNERHGTVQGGQAIEGFADAWARIVVEFESKGYFAKAAPPECVDDDNGVDYDVVGASMEGVIYANSRLKVDWSTVRWDASSLDEETLYSLVECLFDLVARPRRHYVHSYNNCGTHFENFYIPTGQALYAWNVNQALERLGIPLVLESDRSEHYGRLVRIVDAPHHELIHAAMRTSDLSVRERVAHAYALYRGRTATRADKRTACNGLAHILELRRSLLKERVRPDENELFNIANNYAIRHFNDRQKDDYDEVFLDWIFWSFCSAIALTEALIEQEKSDGSTAHF